jgi:hypothetical protein
LDYAFTDLANQSIALYSHIFSLSYKFWFLKKIHYFYKKNNEHKYNTKKGDFQF